MNARLPIVLVLGLAVAACGPKVSKKQPGADDPSYMFPHSTHVDAEVDCKLCHPMDKATKLETGLRHVKIPATPSKQAACKDCHDTDVEFPAPKRERPFRFTFSHADHLPRVNGDCKRCHPTPPESGDAAAKAPPMSACTGCHTHQQDYLTAQCTPCHLDLKGFKPETAFKHEGDWLRSHGGLARPSAETCTACHDQTYCAECHSPQTAAGRPSMIFPERVDRAFIHRGDYVSRHMVDATANPASCQRCHGTPFCASCHELRGVRDLAGIGSMGESSPHRHPDWASGIGSVNFHGRAAQRNILACAGCHDNGADAICATCHRTVNPHPAGFISKHRGDDRSKQPCSICHTN